MHLPNKLLADLEISDIQRLIDIGVGEDKFIEYKSRLNLGPDKDKKEFLADTTAFANALGGEIIYGIEEGDDGLPQQITGIEVDNEDQLKLLIENLLRDCVDERLSGYDFRFIPLDEAANKYVLVFRISMSLRAPHMVKYKSTTTFHIRHDGGKHLMDVREIKMAFERTSGLKEKAEKFINERLEIIQKEVISDHSSSGGFIVGHFVPLLREEYQLDITNQAVIDRLSQVRPPYTQNPVSYRHTFEGFKTMPDISGRGNYNLFFSDGCVEFFEERLIGIERDNDVYLPSVAYEKALIKYFDQIRKFYEDNTFNLPFIYSMSLLNIKGAKLVHTKYDYTGVRTTTYSRKIEKNELHLPKLQINDLSKDSAAILKPLFDMIWNAFGLERSLNYDENDNFLPPK